MKRRPITMKTVVFLDSQKSGSSREAIKAAEQLGYYTVLLTNRIKFIKERKSNPDIHLIRLVDLANIDDIRKALKLLRFKSLDICGIISFVDPYCHLASQLATEFGVNHFSTEAIKNMEDKILSRKVLANTSYSPHFLCIDNPSSVSDDEIESILPAIIKSPLSSGSKDVIKANNILEFKEFSKSLFDKYPDIPVLVEEFIDGPQYLTECFMIEGKLHIIAIIEQEITFFKRFIITGYNLLLHPTHDFYESLYTSIETILQLHGMKNGTCHLEMRYVNNNWKVIEINPRISGGAMNKLLDSAFGINVVKETIKFAIGQDPDISYRFKKHVFADYIVLSEKGILEKVIGRNRASRCPGVQHVYIRAKKGMTVQPPMSMGYRYAYIIATGSTEEEARANAKYATSKIQFILYPPQKRI